MVRVAQKAAVGNRIAAELATAAGRLQAKGRKERKEWSETAKNCGKVASLLEDKVHNYRGAAGSPDRANLQSSMESDMRLAQNFLKQAKKISRTAQNTLSTRVKP